MSVPVHSSRQPYDGNDVATSFPTVFPFVDSATVRVYRGLVDDELEDMTLLVEDIDYAVTGGGYAPGSVVFDDPLPATDSIIIRRVTPITQPLHLTRGGPTLPEATENSLDRRTYVEQELMDGALSAANFEHGDLGGGTLHALAVRGGAAGFMSGSLLDTILDAVEMIDDFVTIDTTQEITGQKTWVVTVAGTSPKWTAADATGPGHLGLYYRHNDTEGELPPGWEVGWIFTNQGAGLTNAWVLISGALVGPDADGIYLPVAPDPDNNAYNLGIRSDVDGPALLVRSLETGDNSYIFAGMNDAGQHTFAVEGSGEIKWGIGTRAQQDTRLYRTGSLGVGGLRTNVRLDVDGGGSFGGRLDLAAGASATIFYDGNLNQRLTWTSDVGPTRYKSWQPSGSPAHIFDTDATFLAGDIYSFRNATVAVQGIDFQGRFNRLLSQRVDVAYSASITIDAALGSEMVITANNGATFTINAVSNPIVGQRLAVRIRNTSGGALGAVTWHSVFKMATWTQPATGNSRSIEFQYDGSNWIEVSRTTADVPL